MFVLTHLNMEEKEEYARSVLAVSKEIQPLKDAALEHAAEATDDVSLEWEVWSEGTDPANTWVVAGLNAYERYEIEYVEEV